MPAPSRHWIAEPDSTVLRPVDAGINAHYLADEPTVVRALNHKARLAPADADRVMQHARELVAAMRKNRESAGGLDAFMGEYDLSSREGIVFMCLAEALLRIPDAETADRLIADKLADANFHEHLGTSESLLVNVATWGLMLTGRIVDDEEVPERAGLGQLFGQMVTRLGEPVIRNAMRGAMRIMSQQFVMGRTITDALKRASGGDESIYRYSFDMLGEAALTKTAADDYFEAYADAIGAIGRDANDIEDLFAAPSISVKLSALSTRFEYAQRDAAVPELAEKLLALAALARDARIALTIDAEESDRLELTLEVFEQVFNASGHGDWPGLGFAVQAYQKRALAVIEWLQGLAESAQRQIPVRLVKGAYWDTEIKVAQERGLLDFPVFTRKSSTDVSYLACAGTLLKASPDLYPQFATHNAHTVAWVMRVGAQSQFEFQRLHGMGEELYSEIVGEAEDETTRPCRVYAPVGRHEDLLPYLVRRLLENGANTSFVNRFAQDDWSVERIVRDPVALTDSFKEAYRHPGIRLPRNLFAEARDNSVGLNLSDATELDVLASAMYETASQHRSAAPIINGKTQPGESITVNDPSDTTSIVGEVTTSDAAMAKSALDAAADFFPQWNATAPAERALRLRAAADLLETHRAELVMLCVAEAGRTVPDSLSEIREAVDFLRYYAHECETLFGDQTTLPGPTGESNTLRMLGRGIYLCISPWNFPVAIFTGQIAAALAAGNTVIAKPAEQTALAAARVIELLLEAGIPTGALHLLPGSGPVIGGALLPDPRVTGVAFTGGTATAKLIERELAARNGPIAALVAETGGVNAMIVDSSALAEQVVKDSVHSAFNSAGQRCSALRLLCLQRETADQVIEMLSGRMAELVIGDPALLRTDVGPVIDAAARQELSEYAAAHAEQIIYQCELGAEHEFGWFFPPTLLELPDASALTQEVFGPVLHVVRYDADALDDLVDTLTAVGYGLTLGIHSRIGSVAEKIIARARVGNIYVNRNMIGAVVGVQPFGGLGLSGTGPKAGGPHYLTRFGVEQSVSTNTAAVGGNTDLLSIDGSSI